MKGRAEAAGFCTGSAVNEIFDDLVKLGKMYQSFKLFKNLKLYYNLLMTHFGHSVQV